MNDSETVASVAEKTSQLEASVQEHPYSALSQYALLCNYLATAHPDADKQLKKTALYFPNAHWLQYQLYRQKFSKPMGYGHSTSVEKEEKVQQHFGVVSEEQLQELKAYEMKTFDKDADFSDEQPRIEEPNENVNLKLLESEIPSHEHESETALAENMESSFDAEISQPTDIKYDDAALEEIGKYESEEPVTVDDEFSIEYPSVTEEPEADEAETSVNDSAEENTAAIPGESYSTFSESPEGQAIAEEVETDPRLTEPDPVAMTKEDAEPTSSINEDAEQPPDDSEGELRIPGIKEVPATGGLAFEPLHTVDYFASQGIILNEEIIANDKLGSQMRSFTDWLKSMKKLHPERMALSSLADDIVENASDNANIDAEVLTESMAEVLIKQDKRGKAIEMYQKLSLINPSKSAYFAAKIEKIKSD